MKNSFFILIFFSGTLAVAGEDPAQNNIQVSNAEAKIKSLRLEKKINKSVFLPELSLKGGLGSEKILDISPDTEKGPFLFLDGKLNLYRGGRDEALVKQTEKDISISQMEVELKKRELQIESFNKISEISILEKENALTKTELELNQNQRKMARKKVDAGLTTSVDLLDFDLKEELLQNDMNKNSVRSEILQKELLALYGNKLSFADLKNMYAKDIEINTAAVSGDVNQLPQMLIAKKKLEISSLHKKSAKGEYLPSVDFEAKYGQLTPRKKLFGEDREHQVALTVTLPLFSGFSTSGKFQQSILEKTQSERELRQNQIDIESKKETDLKKLSFLKKTLASLNILLERSIRYNDLTISDYRRGVKNSPDVIAASDKKYEIQKRILETKLELINLTFSFNENFTTFAGE